jgi:hypothetical protein
MVGLTNVDNTRMLINQYQVHSALNLKANWLVQNFSGDKWYKKAMVG